METIFTKYGSQVRAHPVEIYIDNTNGRYFLPDDVILRQEKVIALSILPPQLNFSTDPFTYISQLSPSTSRPIIGQDAFANAYLTLKEGSDIIMEDMPLTTFALLAGDKTVPQILTTDITPSKSFITIADAANNISAGESVILNFYYLQKSSVR